MPERQLSAKYHNPVYTMSLAENECGDSREQWQPLREFLIIL